MPGHAWFSSIQLFQPNKVNCALQSSQASVMKSTLSIPACLFTSVPRFAPMQVMLVSFFDGVGHEVRLGWRRVWEFRLASQFLVEAAQDTF